MTAPGRNVRIDMHLHTRASHDCLSEPEAVLETAIARGLDRICVTDHNEIEAALRLRERYPDRVIAGEEIKTAEGVDVIGLYLSERIPKGVRAREACERIHAQGGVVYMPHPFEGRRGKGGRVLDGIAGLVDVVEGINARIHSRGPNERAQAWAREHGRPLGAGSDAHTLGEIGRAWVELPAFEDGPAGFLAALREGRIRGSASSRLVHLASTWAKLRKRLGGEGR